MPHHLIEFGSTEWVREQQTRITNLYKLYERSGSREALQEAVNVSIVMNTVLDAPSWFTQGYRT